MKTITAYDVIEKAVIGSWPEHATALAKARPIAGGPRQTQEEVSVLIQKIIGDKLERYVAGYRWMCQMVLNEELEFRRKGHYHLSTFAEAERTVYANRDVMTLYMDGLLLSQVLWSNHITLLDYYIRDFLGGVSGTSSHLEIGPGHGLLLFLAARTTMGRVVGWDVSATSIHRTQTALNRLGARSSIQLEERNLFADEAVTEYFDSVVISEVLEHLERPNAALDALYQRMPPDGRIFVNAPVNSPAIDHIYLFRTPEELVDMVCAAGFKVESVCFAPATGYTEAKARKFGVPISCGIIGRRPA